MNALLVLGICTGFSIGCTRASSTPLSAPAQAGSEARPASTGGEHSPRTAGNETQRASGAQMTAPTPSSSSGADPSSARTTATAKAVNVTEPNYDTRV
ncbi:MAG TPA: hypothetical protein VHW01_25800, partial [Polyangiaceae bacterium]|nr:hypothetical protein [Polyangiaceae bacterium]